MSGGSESSGQEPGNRPPTPPWGAVPPWERGGEQGPPPAQADDDQDTTAIDRPDDPGYGQQAGETVFAGSQGDYGPTQGGYGPPQGDPQGGFGQGGGQQDGYGPQGGETVFGGGQEPPPSGDAPHIPAIPPGEAGERHVPAIPPEEVGERHVPAISPEEAAAYGPQDPYGGQPGYGNQPPPLGGVQGGYGFGPEAGGPQGPPPPGGYGPGGGGPQGPGGFGPPPPPKGGGSKMPLVVALVVAGVLVLGGITAGGVAAVRLSGDETPTPTPSTSSPTPAPTLTTPSAPATSPSTSSLPLPQRINERSHDPTPLSLKELFPATYKGENGYSYKRYTSKLYKGCSSAVKGSSLRSALKKGKCTQVAAATYVDKKHKTVITVGLANMTDLTASKRVDAVVRPPKDIVFSPLNGKSPASFSGKSYYQWAEPIGHYVRWTAATYTNRSPTRTESYERLSVANGDMNDLVNGPLSLRMLKAKP